MQEFETWQFLSARFIWMQKKYQEKILEVFAAKKHRGFYYSHITF